MGDLTGLLREASTWVVPVLLAITLHEAAHGWVAWKLGDDTAQRAGRVTFNPLRHVDPFGTILLPAMLLIARAPFLFGWAKPVPVNFYRLANPRRDMVLVAAAGPGINLFMAVAAAATFHVVPFLPAASQDWIGDNLAHVVLINALLCVFNLLPLPPLDGGRIAVGLLPDVLARPLARLERWGLLIILGLVLVLPLIGRQMGMQLDVFAVIVGTPTDWLIETIASGVGLRR